MEQRILSWPKIIAIGLAIIAAGAGLGFGAAEFTDWASVHTTLEPQVIEGVAFAQQFSSGLGGVSLKLLVATSAGEPLREVWILTPRTAKIITDIPDGGAMRVIVERHQVFSRILRFTDVIVDNVTIHVPRDFDRKLSFASR